MDSEILKFVNNLKNYVKKENGKNDIFIGTVTSIEPLNIDIGNRLIITESQLILGQNCRPHKVKIPHTHKYNGTTENATATGDGDLTITTTGQAQTKVTEVNGHPHEIKDQETDDVHQEHDEGKETGFEDYVIIEIEPKLSVGDKVVVFAFNNYQMFYVAERIQEAE